ncbi:DUF433 domain-containing protein [Neorhizobium sp. CSC1952]|uniref:DUF433 domain-containing protein n=1 Tax=Neorhizobium sp. CSC1952 TaxID=2978974 RepID=UPI0025A5844C|nr:DUF433 domain-containing protein [Rhizobium sp. CSC1952]WJR65442.1 DUF433 domain-containing protein [Rhizobium sp. CSC1952]
MSKETTKTAIAAFTEDQVERLTGVTVHQLRHWDRTGFFVPSMAYEDRSQPLSRLYSFRDLVSLKILNLLRNEHKVSLQHLRQVKETLSHLGEDIWAKTKLYVLKRRVAFDNPVTKAKEEIVTGQGVLAIALEVVTGDMRNSVEDMRRRDETLVGQIETKKGIARSKPVIAGTRIPVSTIKAFAEEGYTVNQIRQEYPTLTEADIMAAIKHKDAA